MHASAVKGLSGWCPAYVASELVRAPDESVVSGVVHFAEACCVYARPVSGSRIIRGR